MKQTILIFSSLATAVLVLFQLGKYSLWRHSSNIELYLVAFGLLFVGLGIALSRFLNNEKHSLQNVEVQTETTTEINQSKLTEVGLSKREYEILLLIADGLSNNEIATQLFISESTVKTHVSKILSKLDAKRRTQAVQISRVLKII